MMTVSNPNLVTPKGKSIIVEFKEKRRGEEQPGNGKTGADEEENRKHGSVVVVIFVLVVVVRDVGHLVT